VRLLVSKVKLQQYRTSQAVSEPVKESFAQHVTALTSKVRLVAKLELDGVFSQAGPGRLTFHPAPPL